jgi:hypothetical protein
MHTRKYHPGKTAPSQTFTPTKLTPTTQQPVKGEKLTQQEDLTPEYNLSESMQNLGLLYPVITDKYGNIIDGFHRLAIDPNCEKLSRDFINTPELLEAARIAANHDRRTPKPDEIKDRIIIMAKKGVSAKEISKLTGVPERTVYRIIPADLKKESAAKISETRKAQSEIVRDVLPNGSSSINIPDKKEINPHPPLGTAAISFQSFTTITQYNNTYKLFTTITVITAIVLRTSIEETHMVTEQMVRKQNRTNIYIIDEELWDWAQYKSKRLDCAITSEYIFKLIKLDKEKDLLKKER